MDRFDQLRCFVRAAELGSFSHAAAEAKIKPSSVSRAVTALEQDIGAAVFNRSTRSLHLTEVGARFLHRARRILDDLDDAVNEATVFNTAPQGVLRLNVPSAFGRLHIVPYLPIFAAKYPNVRLDVIFNDAIVDIIQTGTDLAIRTGVLPDSRLIARKLAPHRHILCASPGFLNAYGPITKIQDLEKSPAALFSLRPNDRWILMDEKNHRHDIVCTGAFRTNDTQALLAAAIDGFGVTLLPIWAAGEALKTGRLVQLFADYETMFSLGERFIFAVYPPKKIVPPKVRVFIDGFAAHIGRPPYWDLW